MEPPMSAITLDQRVEFATVVNVDPFLSRLRYLEEQIAQRSAYPVDDPILPFLRAERDALVEALNHSVADPAYVTTREAAKIAGVSEETIRNWCREKKVRHRRLPGGAYRVHVEDIIVRKVA
jgi:excisionase family DNA binding protein